MQKFNGSLIRQFPNSVSGNAAVAVQVTVFISGTTTEATLYADDDTGGATLPNPLTTNNVGFYSFYAADGMYRLEFNSAQYPDLEIQLVDVDAIRDDFDSLESSNAAFLVAQQAAYDAFVLSQGWDQVGTFAAGFTFTSPNQVGQDADGNWWRWNGAFNKVVTAGTLPSSDSNYKLVGDGVLRSDLAAENSSVLISAVPARELANLVQSRDVASLVSAAFPAANNRCLLQKLRTDYPEFAVYTPLSTDGRDWLRWLFTNRFNVGAAGATRMIGCTLAGLYPATPISKTAANNVSETTGTAATVTKTSADGVKVGTWSTPATVLTTTDVSWSATVGDTCTYTITGVERIALRTLLAGNGGIGKLTITESAVEIPAGNYSLPTGNIFTCLASATSNTTYHIPLAHGLDSSKTYVVEIKVDTTNPGSNRVYTAGLLGYDEIAFNAVGIHGIVTDASLASQTNALSLASFTTAVYQATDATRVDWRYVQTTSGSIVVLTVYDSVGALVATETLDTYATGSTAKNFKVANNLTKGTYYLHVQNGKTKNASSSGYRYYDFGAIAYDETQAGVLGVDEFDNKDMPLNEQDPNNGTEYMLIGSGNLELAILARKTTDILGDEEYLGGIHGHETANSITYKADGATIDFAGAAQFDKFIANRFSVELNTTLVFASDSSAFCDVDYTLSLDARGYGVKTVKTSVADSIIHIDYSIMLNVPSTQASNQAGQTGGGFEVFAADKNYIINDYDDSSTLIYTEQQSLAFVNDIYTACVNYTTKPVLPSLFKTPEFSTDSYQTLVQDRTDRTIKGYTLAFPGVPSTGLTVPSGLVWEHSKVYRIGYAAKTLVGL